MLTSLSLIFLVGLAMGAICQKIKLPRIIGMLAPVLLGVNHIAVSYTHLIILVKMFRCHCSMKREWDIQIE